MEIRSLKSYPTLAPTDESAMDPNSSYAHILQFINGPMRVVDFGCGPGNLARFLAQRGCSVVGVDINPESAALAKEYCDDVIVADLDSASIIKLFPSDRFDALIFADILEHLRDPWRILTESHQILRAGGFVIASIPNIAHGAIRLSMLQGNFDYQEVGILDNTHLRFFTHKSIENLFDRCGFSIEETTRTWTPVFEPTELVPVVDKADFPDEIVRQIESDPEAETLQFVLKAAPATSSEMRSTSLKKRNAVLESRVLALQSDVQRLQRELHGRGEWASGSSTVKGPDGTEAGRRIGEIAMLKEELTRVARLHSDLETAEVGWKTERADLLSELESVRRELANSSTFHDKLTGEIGTLKDELARVAELHSTLEAASKSWSAERADLLAQHERSYAQWQAGRNDMLARVNSVQDELARVRGLYTELELAHKPCEAERLTLAAKIQFLESTLAQVQDETHHQEVLRGIVAAHNRELSAELSCLRLSYVELQESNNRTLQAAINGHEEERARPADGSEHVVDEREALAAEIRRLGQLELELRERIIERQSANDAVCAERDQLQLQLDTDRQSQAKRIAFMEETINRLSRELETSNSEISRLYDVESELRERILERQHANDELTAQRDYIHSVMEEMGRSKVWRLRSAWRRVKKAFSS